MWDPSFRILKAGTERIKASLGDWRSVQQWWLTLFLEVTLRWLFKLNGGLAWHCSMDFSYTLGIIDNFTEVCEISILLLLPPLKI